MVEEVVHHGEYTGIVAGCSHHQSWIAESILDYFGHVGAGQVGQHHLLGTLLAQHIGQSLGSLLGAAMYAGIDNQHTFTLGFIAAPGFIQAHSLLQGSTAQHGSVQGADGLRAG